MQLNSVPRQRTQSLILLFASLLDFSPFKEFETKINLEPSQPRAIPLKPESIRLRKSDLLKIWIKSVKKKKKKKKRKRKS